MKLHEFGNPNAETVLLLHGGGLSWWNFREEAKLLEKKFHVVLPVLDGHGGSEDGFESIERNAMRIIAYIDEHLGGQVPVLGGLSLGAQIAVQILALRPDICKFALIESVSLIPSPVTHALIGPSFSGSYFLIKYDWFSRLQFQSMHIRRELYEDYYADTCKIGKEDLVSFMKANTAFSLPEGICRCGARALVIVGGREQGSMKRSAKMLCGALPDARLYTADGMYHGELSLNYPERYVQLLTELME